MVGGQAALASKLGFKGRRNVWPWFNGRRVPAEYCPAIEQATAGAVRCEDLRPDVAWGVLRICLDVARPLPATITPKEVRDAA